MSGDVSYSANMEINSKEIKFKPFSISVGFKGLEEDGFCMNVSVLNV